MTQTTVYKHLIRKQDILTASQTYQNNTEH